MKNKKDMVIDTHAHVVNVEGADGVLQRLIPYPPNPLSNSSRQDVEERVAWLDKEGIDLQLISPSPLTHKTKITVDWCRRHNDLLSELVNLSPSRLRGCMKLPMHDIPAAISEMNRARGIGLLMPYLMSDHGPTLDHPTMDDFYSAVVEKNLPLVVHGSLIAEGNRWVDERLMLRQGVDLESPFQRWSLGLIWGFPYEETLAALTLIFGGVLDRHPDIRVCIPHGAGALPFIVGRIVNGAAKLPGVPEFLRPQGAVLERVRRLWVDADLHDRQVLAHTKAVLGEDRIILGTDFPNWAHSPLSIYERDELVKFSSNAQRFLGD